MTVQLVTPLPCSVVPLQAARFEPLVVGDALAEQTQRCQDQQLSSTYAFAVRVPSSGVVTVTPGDQPAATFDAAQALAAGSIIIQYAQRGAGRYAVTATDYGSSTAEQEGVRPA